MDKKTLDRFWSKVKKTDSCWNWTATKTKGDYGQFRVNNKMVRSHRFSYELFKGKIPDGFTLDHLCRNPSCVNPDHLEVVTMKENILRGTSFSAINARKTHCIHGHEFTPKNTYFIRTGKGCRICQRDKIRKYQSLHRKETSSYNKRYYQKKQKIKTQEVPLI